MCSLFYAGGRKHPDPGLPGRLGESEAEHLAICGGRILADTKRVRNYLCRIVIQPERTGGNGWYYTEVDPDSKGDAGAEGGTAYGSRCKYVIEAGPEP